jgi:hypothetical protein
MSLKRKSNMFNSVNNQAPRMNRGEGKNVIKSNEYKHNSLHTVFNSNLKKIVLNLQFKDRLADWIKKARSS